MKEEISSINLDNGTVLTIKTLNKNGDLVGQSSVFVPGIHKTGRDTYKSTRHVPQRGKKKK